MCTQCGHPASAWNGPQLRGAARQARKDKRTEAEQRNSLTPPQDRRRYREGSPAEREAMTASLTENTEESA
jgi:hypothetical protein